MPLICCWRRTQLLSNRIRAGHWIGTARQKWMTNASLTRSQCMCWEMTEVIGSLSCHSIWLCAADVTNKRAALAHMHFLIHMTCAELFITHGYSWHINCFFVIINLWTCVINISPKAASKERVKLKFCLTDWLFMSKIFFSIFLFSVSGLKQEDSGTVKGSNQSLIAFSLFWSYLVKTHSHPSSLPPQTPTFVFNQAGKMAIHGAMSTEITDYRVCLYHGAVKQSMFLMRPEVGHWVRGTDLARLREPPFSL